MKNHYKKQNHIKIVLFAFKPGLKSGNELLPHFHTICLNSFGCFLNIKIKTQNSYILQQADGQIHRQMDRQTNRHKIKIGKPL